MVAGCELNRRDPNDLAPHYGGLKVAFWSLPPDVQNRQSRWGQSVARSFPFRRPHVGRWVPNLTVKGLIPRSGFVHEAGQTHVRQYNQQGEGAYGPQAFA